MLNQEIKLKNKTSNTLLNNISNNKISYPKSTLNTNPSRKNQLNKIKSTSHNTKYKNDLKKPLMITTTNSIEKMMLRHRKMKLNNVITKNNNNKNYNNSLKNSILNEESQKEEISKGNQSNRNSKKNSVVLKNNNNNLNNLILNNNILNNDNYDNNYINDNNQIEYGKIFGLLNNEIKEITDLFKRTQSVDQQKNKEKDIRLYENLPIYTEGNNFDPHLIDSDLFERECNNEDDKFEKMIDVSQLENEENENSDNKNKSQSILFSSYNSELYKNLINTNHNNYENNDIDDNNNLSASSIRNNIIQIAKNNINFQENYKNKNENNKSEINDKTECQFIDVDFNKEIEYDDSNNLLNRNNNDSNVNENILDGIDSEKTDTLIDETSNTNNGSKNIPIQEIMQKIRGE